MKKKIMFSFVLFLLVFSLLAAAQEAAEDNQDTSEECGFWCKVWKFLFGDEDREPLIGKAGEITVIIDGKKYNVKLEKGGIPYEDLKTGTTMSTMYSKTFTLQGTTISYYVNDEGNVVGYTFEGKEKQPISGEKSPSLIEFEEGLEYHTSSGGIKIETSPIPPLPTIPKKLSAPPKLDDQNKPTGGTAGETGAEACSDCVKLPGGYSFPESQAGNFLKTGKDGNYLNDFKDGAGVNTDGNLVGFDKGGNKVIYSPNGLTKVDIDGKAYVLGKDGKYGPPVETGINTDKIAGKLSLLGGQTTVLLSDGKRLVGSMEVDEDTFKKIQSFSPTKLNVEGNKLSWKDSKDNDYSIESSIDDLTSIKTTTTKFADKKEETTWTTADGKSYKESDGWEFKGGTTLKRGDIEIFQRETDKGTEITKTNIKTGETKEILRIPGKGEQHTVTDKDGKTTEWKLWDTKGNLQAAGTKYSNKGTRIETTLYDKNGEMAGICYGESTECNGKPDNPNNFWTKRDSACPGTKKHCSDKDNWKTEDEWNKLCGDGSGTEACDAQKAINDKEFNYWWLSDWKDIAGGKTRGQQLIGSVLNNWKPGWRGLSSWWLPDTTKEWNKKASETFDKLLLAEYAVPAAVCDYDAKHRTKVPGESSVFIEVSPGIVQFVGSIQAERSKESTPILCHYENKTCTKGLTCKKDVCYDSNNKPATGYFYKITWGVTAPQDDKRTPYLDENGIAIKFNLKFKGENWWLYADDSGRGNKNTIQLKNGARDGGTIAHYSNKDFNEVCIEFGAPPTDVGGGEVKEPICAEFVDSDVGRVEFETSGASSSTTTTSGKVSYNSNW